MVRILSLLAAKSNLSLGNRPTVSFERGRQGNIKCRFAIVFALLCTLNSGDASALDILDGLLPTPYLLRSRADDLGIDEPTKARIEKMYKAAEPKYHQIGSELKELTQGLEALLRRDESFDNRSDGEVIAQNVKSLLDVDNQLELYLVRVRVNLLSQVSAEQRQQARNYASEKLESARWRGDVLEDQKLDLLLPKPFWLRSRAMELGVDADTRQQLEQTYVSLEPEYHELKANLKPLTKLLFEVLLAETLDEEEIVKRFDALLKAENELKLHQVHVRVSLFSHLSRKQRLAARKLIKSKPEADWRRVLAEKVERARTLAKQLGEKGQSVVEVEHQLTSVADLVAEGRPTTGGAMLDQVILDLQSRLGEDANDESMQDNASIGQLASPTFANVSYGSHSRNVLDFWQAESSRPTPLAVYFHGGGFRSFDKGKITTKWPATVQALLDAKISVAAVNYRLIQDAPLPAAFHDSRRAVQFLRTKSSDWNIDRSKVSAWGGSAGAQIAMYLAFHDDMAQPDSSDLVERQSTRLACVATRDGQTSRDYQWWLDHLPDYDQTHIDFHAMFGVNSREEFLKKMVDVSAQSLITKDDPAIYMNYEMMPDDPVPEPTASNPRARISFQGHHVVFGIELKTRMNTLGVPCHLDYPGSQCKYKTVEQFLISKLNDI